MPAVCSATNHEAFTSGLLKSCVSRRCVDAVDGECGVTLTAACLRPAGERDKKKAVEAAERDRKVPLQQSMWSRS